MEGDPETIIGSRLYKSEIIRIHYDRFYHPEYSPYFYAANEATHIFILHIPMKGRAMIGWFGAKNISEQIDPSTLIAGLFPVYEDVEIKTKTHEALMLIATIIEDIKSLQP